MSVIAQYGIAPQVGFSDRPGFIWFNGEFVRWPTAHLHVLSHGLHYAQTVFEGERAYGGKIFKLGEHTERLLLSAELLGFTVPFSAHQLSQACEHLIKLQNLTEAYIRPIAWLGSETMGISPQGAKVQVAIAAWEWKDVFKPEARMGGIDLCISRWRRPPPACSPVQAKAAGLYTICVLSRAEANAAGYDDALLLDYSDGVGEATGANVFMVKDNVVYTPETHSVLNGITRQTAMHLLRNMGFEVIEKTISCTELKDAAEVFLTGTAYEIQPVRSIDGKMLGRNPVSISLSQRYKELVYAADPLALHTGLSKNATA